MTEPSIVATVRERYGNVKVDTAVWTAALFIAFNAAAYDQSTKLLHEGKTATEIERNMLGHGETVLDAALYFGTWHGRNMAYILNGESK